MYSKAFAYLLLKNCSKIEHYKHNKIETCLNLSKYDILKLPNMINKLKFNEPIKETYLLNIEKSIWHIATNINSFEINRIADKYTELKLVNKYLHNSFHNICSYTNYKEDDKLCFTLFNTSNTNLSGPLTHNTLFILAMFSEFIRQVLPNYIMHNYIASYYKFLINHFSGINTLKYYLVPKSTIFFDNNKLKFKNDLVNTSFSYILIDHDMLKLLNCNNYLDALMIIHNMIVNNVGKQSEPKRNSLGNSLGMINNTYNNNIKLLLDMPFDEQKIYNIFNNYTKVANLDNIKFVLNDIYNEPEFIKYEINNAIDFDYKTIDNNMRIYCYGNKDYHTSDDILFYRK